MATCPACGSTFQPQGSRGRPRTYCSPTCTRRTDNATRPKRARQAARDAYRADLEAVINGRPPWWWGGTTELAREQLAELVGASS